MRKMRKQNSKIIAYLPILFIVLSISIIFFSTFAYFTDKADEKSLLTFSKVELSSETTVGLDGKLYDIIPGDKLVDGVVSFSKAVESEPIYVRAKISFSLPRQFANDEDMQAIIKQLRNATDFNIKTGAQGDAVWSAKDGNYYYLVESGNTSTLKKVDTIDTYVLSDEITIPRDLTQLDGNAQYMKGVNFHVAFEAVQADNISNVLSETKQVFNTLFPMPGDEMSGINVTIMKHDLVSVLEVKTLASASKISEPELSLPVDGNGTSTKVLDGWYVDAGCTQRFDFNSNVTASITLYPKVIDVSNGLEFTPIYETGGASVGESPVSNAIIGYSVADGTCEDSVVVVPMYYMGTPVTEISERGFDGNTKIKQVILPETISVVNGYAFSSCVNLEKINLPSNITYLGQHAFYYCKKLNSEFVLNGITNIYKYTFGYCEALESVVLGENLTSIGEFAFTSCKKLESITIPKNVASIENHAFETCYLLTEINFNATNMNDLSSDKYENLVFEDVGRDGTGIKVTIGSNVKRIPAYLFCVEDYVSDYSYVNINEIIFEDGSECEEIGDYAFAQAKNLTTITIPKSVTCIGINPFAFATNLNEIILEDGISGYVIENDCLIDTLNKKIVIGLGKDVEFDDITTVGESAFAYRQVESINIDGLITIEKQAFKMSALKSLDTLNDTVTTIGEDAFSACNSLTSITLPESITSIGDGAFEYCSYVTKLNYNIENLADFANGRHGVFDAVGYQGDGVELVIGDEVTKIPAYMFSYNSLYGSSDPKPNIKILKFAENSKCTTIGQNAFDYNINLEYIEFPSSITTLGAYVFNNCEKIKEIDLKANITSAERIFDYSSSGEKVDIKLTIADNVTKICNGLFANINITNIVFGENPTLSEIGNSAFAYNGITRVDLPDSVTTLGSNVFSYCANLEVINISNSITSIGAGAFKSCPLVKEINYNANITSDLNSNDYIFSGSGSSAEETVLNIGADVTRIPGYLCYSYSNIDKLVFAENSKCSEIGRYAFTYNKELTELKLPDSMTTIDTFVFTDCTGLTSIEFGAGLKTVGSNTFVGCNNVAEWKYNATAMDNMTTNSNYSYGGIGSETDGINIIIGENVTSIPDYAFYANTGIKVANVTFEGVSKCESIGQYAFSGCKVLTSITIPNSVTRIGSNAFSGCTDLTGFNFPTAMTVISSYMFSGCISLESITIPEHITSIGDNAFYNCNKIEEINYNANLTTAPGSSNSIFAMVGKNTDGATLNIGKNVSSIPAYLFSPSSSNNYKANITTLRFEEESICTTIGYSAFRYNSNLVDVQLPNSLTTISDYAFNGCFNLTSIKLPSGLQSIVGYAFEGCTALIEVMNLSSLEIEVGLTTNGYVACYAIVVHGGETSQLKTIDNFRWLNGGLGSIYLLEYLGEDTEIILPNNFEGNTYQIYHEAFRSETALTSITLSNGVEGIGDFAFQDCSGLTSIEIPASVVAIGVNPFVGCLNLSISVNSGNTKYKYENNCLIEIETKTIIKGDNSSIVPSDTLKIGDYAFYNCSSLSGEVIPSSVTNIGAYAFYNCQGLTELTIPNSVTYIGDHAFDTCWNVATINFNARNLSDMQSGSQVFYKTGMMTSGVTVKFGSQVTKVPSYIFYTGSSSYAPNITSVIFESNSVCTSIGSTAFMYLTKLTTIELPSSLNAIGNSAFASTSLTEIVIPNNVTTIGNLVFSNCSSLQSVTLSNQLLSIGEKAFESCRLITTISMPDTLTSIGKSAFSSCTSLQTVNMSNNLTSIGDGAFQACSALTKITIPAKVTSIGNSTFFGCTALSEIVYNAELASDLVANNNTFYNAGSQSGSIALTIGASVIAIPNYLFAPVSGSSTTNVPRITTITFEGGSNCTRIGNYAFYNCKYLTNIIIPEKITTIGASAFYGCTGVLTIDYRATECGDLTSTSSAFRNVGNSSIGVVATIANNVTIIPQYMFGGSSSTYAPKIHKVVFEANSVCTTISDNAFRANSNIRSVILPSSITSIGNYAFGSVTGFILCANDTIAGLAKTAKTTAMYIFVVDTTTNFDTITFTTVDKGDVVATASNNTYLKTNTGVYYKKYTA